MFIHTSNQLGGGMPHPAINQFWHLPSANQKKGYHHININININIINNINNNIINEVSSTFCMVTLLNHLYNIIVDIYCSLSYISFSCVVWILVEDCHDDKSLCLLDGIIKEHMLLHMFLTFLKQYNNNT